MLRVWVGKNKRFISMATTITILSLLVTGAMGYQNLKDDVTDLKDGREITRKQIKEQGNDISELKGGVSYISGQIAGFVGGSAWKPKK